MVVKGKDGKLKMINYVEILEDDKEEEHHEYTYDSNRVIAVKRLTGKEDHITMGRDRAECKCRGCQIRGLKSPC